MTKLQFNANKIEKEVIPSIERAILKLNSAINDVGTLKIPNDFEYIDSIEQLIQKNKDTKNKLLSKKTKLMNAIENYEKVEKNNMLNVSNIKTNIYYNK